MDISETWKKLDEERLGQPIEGDFKKNRSNHLVSKLKRNYFIKSIMMIVFVIAFAASTIYFDEILTRSLFAALTVFYIFFLVFSYLTYKKIDLDGPVIEVLTRTKEQISRALRFETLTSLMFYPFAGAAGYLAGFSITGKSADRVFESTTSIATFAIAVVVMTIFGYLIGKKLTHEGYGKSMEEISKMIEQLKS